MACDLTKGRKVPCKDVVGGIYAVYFVDFGDLGTITLTNDEVTDISGTFSAYQYLVKGNSSFEQAFNSSRENGTTFFTQTLNLTLTKLTKDFAKYNYKALFLSLEMSNDQLAKRYISLIGDIENWKIRNGRLQRIEIDKANKFYLNVNHPH